MYREQKKGLFYSIAFHLLFLLLMFFGLPEFLKNSPPIEPIAITVELLPISEITNVKPSDITPKKTLKKPKPKAASKPPKPKPTPTPKPTPKAVSTPKPPKPKPTPKPPVKNVKKDRKKTLEKKRKNDEAKALENILKNLKKHKPSDKPDNKKPKKTPKKSGSSIPKAISSRFDPNQRMSISEISLIQGQIAKCWSPPAGAKNAQDLDVFIEAEYNIDGSYIDARLASRSRSRYRSDRFFRAAADSALRAVRMCNKLKNLNPAKYDAWKSMELHFNPKDML